MKTQLASSPRIVLTGLGIVAANGTGRAAFTSGLREGRRGIAPVTLFDVSDQKTSLAGEVKGFDPATVLPAALRELGSRSDALGILAADEAVRDAKLPPAGVRTAALIVGGSAGGMLETEEFFARVHADPSLSAPLARLLSHPLSAPADHIALALGIHGPRRSICTACSSSAYAIAAGADMLRRGECDVVIAGGTDALCRLTYSGFNALSAVDANPCRPFDAKRAGLNLGEGAAFVVMERLDDARARGARITVELLGAGAVSEAHHITNPQASGEGAARAMRNALADAGVDASQVDYVNAHGTATPHNDAMEAAAIRTVFGARAEQVFVSSTKGLTGHTLGAAGAIEVVACMLGMEGGFVPPSAGLNEVDPKCAGMRHVANESVEAKLSVCVSNSFAFGGNDVVVCLGVPDVGDARVRSRARGRSAVMVTGLGAVSPTGNGTAGIDAAIARAPAKPVEPAILPEKADSLDVTKARRLNRFARLATEAAAQSLKDAAFTITDPDRIGAALGTGWGSLDETAAFMGRVNQRGARLAPPADFPSLVLSAAAGHLSIFLGMRGPTLTTPALTVSGEAAVVAGAEEILSGRADVMAAVGTEEKNPLLLGLIDRLSTGVTGAEGERVLRSEGATCVLLESEETARARNAKPLARLSGWHQATYAPGAGLDPRADDAGGELAETVARAVRGAMAGSEGEPVDAVVVAVATPAIRDGITAALGGFPALYEVAPHAGVSEAVGALAVAAAVRLVARGEAPRGVLALGTAPGSAYAIRVTRP